MTISEADLYQNEEKEILVLTNDTSSGAGKNGKDKLWTASKIFLAYIDIATNELRNGDGRLEWILTDEDLKAKRSDYPYYFKNGCIYRLKVKAPKDKMLAANKPPAFYNRFWVVSVLEENVPNKELLTILEEYRKPVKIADESLGTFELNKDSGQFEGEINWCGEIVLTYLEVDKNERETCVNAVKALRSLLEQQEQKDAELRAFAAEKLTALANEWRLSDDENKESAEITKQMFMERINLSELLITKDGEFTAYYDDDDMFWKHAITVDGFLKNGLKNAQIAG